MCKEQTERLRQIANDVVSTFSVRNTFIGYRKQLYSCYVTLQDELEDEKHEEADIAEVLEKNYSGILIDNPVRRCDLLLSQNRLQTSHVTFSKLYFWMH